MAVCHLWRFQLMAVPTNGAEQLPPIVETCSSTTGELASYGSFHNWRFPLLDANIYTPSTTCQTLRESHCDYTSHERHRSAAYVTVALHVCGGVIHTHTPTPLGSMMLLPNRGANPGRLRNLKRGDIGLQSISVI